MDIISNVCIILNLQYKMEKRGKNKYDYINRWFMLKSKEIKYKLAFWRFVDKYMKEITKNPDEFEKKIVSTLAEVIHEAKKPKSET